MQAAKNTPRTPEEQQRALEEFLAAQEKEKKDVKGKKKPVLSSILRTSRKLSKGEELPNTSHTNVTVNEPQTPSSPQPTRFCLPKIDIPHELSSSEESSTSETSIKPQIKIPSKLSPRGEPFITKTTKNKPLTPGEQQKAFEAYLATMDNDNEKDKPMSPRNEPIIAKTKKNKPLTPEEQEKAFEEYLAQMEKEKKPKRSSHHHSKDNRDSVLKNEPIIAKTTKNKPLTPEEQEKAFEEYLAQMEKEKSRPRSQMVSTKKNVPRSVEEQKRAMQQFIEENENISGPRLKQSSKNRPLTPEEQQIALMEFKARQQMENKDPRARIKESQGKHRLSRAIFSKTASK